VAAQDVSVQTEIDVTSSEARLAGVVARAVGAGDQNMYLGAVYHEGSQFIARIYRNVNGTWTVMAQTVVSSGTGKLKFQVNNASLKLIFQGNLVLQVIDNNPLPAGSVGIRAWGNVSLDNFNVS
jgi:hypothetical protein